MSDTTPTPEQARVALAEADGRTRGVRRADGQFRFILLAIAAMYVAIGVVVGRYPHGGHFAGPAVLTIFVAGVAATAALGWRIRAYSKPGMLRFALYLSAFTVWNSVVVAVSLSGWFGPNQPGWHFTVSAAVASLPLLVAAWLLSPPRR
jgi:hypothetical protein